MREVRHRVPAMEGEKKKIHFDDVFDVIGHMGLFQWVIFALMLIGSAWGVEAIYMVFVGEYSALPVSTANFR